jgi:hypothetical protein
MDRLRLALLGVGCLAVVTVVGVQLADPLERGPEAPAVDYDDPAGELAADALRQEPARDHVVAYWFGKPGQLRANQSKTLVRIRVDADTRRARAVSNRSGHRVDTFANEHVVWQGFDGDLRYEGRGDPTPYRALGSRFDHLELLPSAPNVTKTVNGSTAVVHVRDTDTAYALVEGRRNITDDEYAREERFRANLTIVVDRETDTPRRVVYWFARSPDGNGSQRRVTATVYEYRWQSVEVERPSGVGYTLAEFLFDLAD